MIFSPRRLAKLSATVDLLTRSGLADFARAHGLHLTPHILSQSGDLLAALPRRLDPISARLAHNAFQARLDTPQIEHLLLSAHKVANRVFAGLVLAGVLVASGMLLKHQPTLGTVGFVIAAELALYMVGAILRNDRTPS